MRATPISADVSDLVCGSMQALPHDCQLLLQYAACSGHETSLQVLRAVLPSSMTFRALLRAIHTVEHLGFLICTSHADDLALLVSSAGDLELPTALTDAGAGAPAAADAHHTLLLSQLDAIRLQFAHDRVQSAAYRLIPPAELPVVHCVITKQLLAAYGHSEIDEFALDIAGHIRDGLSATAASVAISASCDTGPAAWSQFLSTPQMFDRVTTVLLLAASQAKKASAYGMAIRFLEVGLRIMEHRGAVVTASAAKAADLLQLCPSQTHSTSNGDASFVEEAYQHVSEDTWHRLPAEEAYQHVSEDTWHRLPALCFQFFNSLCFCLFLDGRADSSTRCIEYTIAHLSNVADRSTLWELHIQVLMTKGSVEQALGIGLDYLKELGVELETHMSPELEAWVKGPPPFDGQDESTYRHHPIFHLEPNPNRMVMTLLSSLGAAAFIVAPHLFPRIAYTLLNETRHHGVAPESAVGMGLYVVTLWGTHSMYKENYSLGCCAKMLMDSFGEFGRMYAARTDCCVLADTFIWRRPLRACVELTKTAFEEAFTVGALEWGAYLGMFAAEIFSVAGLPVPVVIQQQRQILNTLVMKRCTVGASYCEALLECSQSLVDVQRAPLEAPKFHLPIVQFSACSAQALVFTVMNEPRAAMRVANLATPAKAPNTALVSNISYEFYSALSKLACLALDFAVNRASPPRVNHESSSSDVDDTPDEAARRTTWLSRLAEVDAHIRLLRIWSEVAPQTFQHKLLLVTAERHRVLAFSPALLREARTDLVAPAVQLYEEASALAAKCGYSLEAALSLELAARFQDRMFMREDSVPARVYRREALRLYEQAGATAKVGQMKNMSAAADTSYPWDASMIPPHAATKEYSGDPSSCQSDTLFGLDSKCLKSASRSWQSSGSSCDSESSCSQSSVGCDHRATSITLESNTIRTSEVDVTTTRSTTSLDESRASRSAASASTLHLADAYSILKAATSFFHETDETTLLEKLMSIVLEVAGASRGTLVLKDSEQNWRVELTASIDSDQGGGPHRDNSSPRPLGARVQPDLHQPAAASAAGVDADARKLLSFDAIPATSDLPLSIVQFVIKSLESVLLSDPHLDPLSVWRSGQCILPKRMQWASVSVADVALLRLATLAHPHQIRTSSMLVPRLSSFCPC